MKQIYYKMLLRESAGLQQYVSYLASFCMDCSVNTLETVDTNKMLALTTF